MPPELIKFSREHKLTFEQAEAIQNIVDETGLSLEEAKEVWISSEGL
jgi:hypothetical protein